MPLLPIASRSNSAFDRYRLILRTHHKDFNPVNTFEGVVVEFPDVVDGFLHVFISQLYPNPNPNPDSVNQ